jgi:hypothetical protein
MMGFVRPGSDFTVGERGPGLFVAHRNTMSVSVYPSTGIRIALRLFLDSIVAWWRYDTVTFYMESDK